MLYIHIPYCKGKCIYCDFYSGGCPDWQRYLKALVNELSERIGEIDGSLSSIYMGGGTPSLIPPDEFGKFIEDLMSMLSRNGVSLSPELEFTVEVNPEDVDDTHIEMWKRSGVNRVSMGIQSLIDSELQFLHRRHNALRAIEAAGRLGKSFGNISVDLIYGLPGQTEENLRHSIRKILCLAPAHISAYALSFEEGTPLYIFEMQGKVKRLTDDEYVRYGHIVEAALEAGGYKRYEISNYSLPGFQSRHNKGYWEGKPYLGLGPSAASYDGDRIRRMNPSDLRGYLDRFSGNVKKGDKGVGETARLPHFYQEEILGDEELRDEKVMVTLRTVEGLDLNEYKERFGRQEGERLLRSASRWLKSGELIQERGRLRLSARGWDISDYIIIDLLK